MSTTRTPMRITPGTGTSLPHRVLVVIGRAALTVGAVLGVGCVLAGLAAVCLGLRPVVITSGSMSPAIDTGALVIARSVPAGDIGVGDVVTVPASPGSNVTHRVVAVTHRADGSATLRLRGDANEANDPTVYPVRSAERTEAAIPYLGRFVAVVNGPTGIALGVIALGGLLLHALARTPRGRRRVLAVPALVLVLTATSVGALTGSTRSSQAVWTNDVTATSTMGTLTVAPSSSFTCGSLGIASVTFNWSAVTGATNYTLHFGPGGGSTQTVAGTSATILTIVNGGTAWVQANRNFGSTTWTSVASQTRTYTIAALVLSTCV